MNPEKISAARFSELVAQCWGEDTCWDAMRETWTPDNPAHGQCLVTCALAQKYVHADASETEDGGWIVRPAYAVTPEQQAANENWQQEPEKGVLHFYLQILEGPDFDPTFCQFAEGTKLVRADEAVDIAQFVDDDFKERCKILEDRFLALLTPVSETLEGPAPEVPVPPTAVVSAVAPGIIPPDLAEKLAAEEREEEERKKKLEEEPEPTPP